MTSLYMFPSIKKKFFKKSRGLTSPTFLEFQKEKRKKRQEKRKKRRALKRIFKKMRKKTIMKAFNNIYFYEKSFDSIQWKLIEKRFLDHTGRSPPAAIVYWFLDD